jgi:hypothetical protein
MATDAVYDAIMAHLKDSDVIAVLSQPVSGVPPIRFENDDQFAVPDAKPWISMALSGVVYGQASIGASAQADNLWDEKGELWLVVIVPKGSGGSQARSIAKKLADIFRGLQLLDDDLEFLDAFIGQGGPAQEEGSWYELPLVIDWRYAEA